jgi:excisionase family DNA binding protein
MSSYTVQQAMATPLPMSYIDDLFARFGVTMSVAEVAMVLGRPHSTIYKWLNDGTIPASKVGESWVIYRDEIKALISSGRNLPADIGLEGGGE